MFETQRKYTGTRYTTTFASLAATAIALPEGGTK